MTWTLIDPQRETLRNPEALASVIPLLERLISAFGQGATARLLDVTSGTIPNWKSGRRTIDPVYARRVIDLHDVFNRALQTLQPATVMTWLVGNEPFLNHRRPIDVLASDGAAPLIAALNALEAGAYA
jgi:uncharacterized protein (DUF2384 family)